MDNTSLIFFFFLFGFVVSGELCLGLLEMC